MLPRRAKVGSIKLPKAAVGSTKIRNLRRDAAIPEFRIADGRLGPPPAVMRCITSTKAQIAWREKIEPSSRSIESRALAASGRSSGLEPCDMLTAMPCQNAVLDDFSPSRGAPE